MATRFHSSSDGPAAGRTVPNLPGALVRHLSRRLSVSPTVAMRIALLYGDIEWRASGATRLAYSARDYARRMGLHPHTVQADLRHLIAIGAIEADYNPTHAATLQLRGLLPLLSSDATTTESDPAADSPAGRFLDPAGRKNHPPSTPGHPAPGRFLDPAPGRSVDPALVDETTQPWSKPSTTLEKASKTQEKEDRKKKRGKPARCSGDQEQAEQPGSLQSPGGGRSRAKGSGAEPQEPAGSPELQPGAPEPQATPAEGKALEQAAPEPNQGPGGTALLDRLLAAFRDAAPPEWPAPERLTASRERRSRLRQALEHAGSAEALEHRLRAALGAVPPWFRATYPVRPDGSRRPAYQFFDLLLRASAAERDCGVEAWHLFAWSEGSGGGGANGARQEESELQRARRLLRWSLGSQIWCCQGIEALRLPLPERRRLAALLEAHGEGVAGTGASQFADHDPDPDDLTVSQPETPDAVVGEC